MNVFSSFPLFFVGCVLTCKRKNWTDLREKAASQCWQRYFLSPVWSLTWRSRDLLCLKSRRQKLQRNGISSPCACQTQNASKPINFWPSRLFPRFRFLVLLPFRVSWGETGAGRSAGKNCSWTGRTGPSWRPVPRWNRFCCWPAEEWTKRLGRPSAASWLLDVALSNWRAKGEISN